MALLSSPLASYGVPGAMTLSPGMCASHALPRLRVLRRELQRGAVRPAEDDRHLVLAARHVEHLRRGVHDLVDREQREVPGHELDDRAKPDHRRADADAGEAELGDRRVDDAHLAELLEESLGDLVRALVDGDFLAHEEDAVVALHLLADGLAEGVSVRDDWHLCGELVRSVAVSWLVGSLVSWSVNS